MELIQERNNDITIVPQGNEAVNVLAVIERAANNPAVDIEKMERLLQMQERILNRNAHQAFASAFAEMQPELPEVLEKGKAHNSKYSTLEDINAAVKPVLAKHGFGLGFRVNQEGTTIKVTGILSHREGHSESTELSGAADNSGSKNAIQAVGSSVSYLKRYVLCALLNISTRGEDDDGATSDPKPTEPQLTAIKKLLMNATQKAKDQFVEKYESLENVKRGQVDKLTAWLKKNQEPKNAA